MGCCQNNNHSSSLQSNLFYEKLRSAIESGSHKTVSIMLQILSKKTHSKLPDIIDEDFIMLKSYHLNILAYSVFLGNEKMFKYLLEKGASINRMEKILESQNIRAINIICFKGHLNLLRFYLPIYLKNKNNTDPTDKSFTLDLKDSQTSTNFIEFAIHSACRSGMVNIVLYIYNYFKSNTNIPQEFSIHSVNDYFEEDAGLIACRYGNFPTVKLLHEKCGVKFDKLNRNKENAVMICIIGHKNSFEFSYLECISYLIEIVKVDIKYMYEEMLLLSECEEITNYLEKQLEKVGIYVKKKDIDRAVTSVRVVYEEWDNSKAPIFTEDVRDYLRTGNSILSSISDLSKRFESSSLDLGRE